MTPEQFCYWLQGFIEISNPKDLKVEELQKIKDHLNTVFTKVTPNYIETVIGGAQISPSFLGTTLC